MRPRPPALLPRRSRPTENARRGLPRDWEGTHERSSDGPVDRLDPRRGRRTRRAAPGHRLPRHHATARRRASGGLHARHHGRVASARQCRDRLEPERPSRDASRGHAAAGVGPACRRPLHGGRLDRRGTGAGGHGIRAPRRDAGDGRRHRRDGRHRAARGLHVGARRRRQRRHRVGRRPRHGIRDPGRPGAALLAGGPGRRHGGRRRDPVLRGAQGRRARRDVAVLPRGRPGRHLFRLDACRRAGPRARSARNSAGPARSAAAGLSGRRPAVVTGRALRLPEARVPGPR